MVTIVIILIIAGLAVISNCLRHSNNKFAINKGSSIQNSDVIYIKSTLTRTQLHFATCIQIATMFSIKELVFETLKNH